MAFTRVQGNSAGGTASNGNVAVTISAVASGNAVCGVVSWDNGGGVTLSSVADDKGNTYNVETTVLDTTNGQKAAAFSRTNITNAPVTITATFSAGAGFRSIAVDEFSGVSAASTDERDGTTHGGQFQNSPGTGANGITSGTFTTATNGDLVWGGSVGSGGGVLASNGTGFSTGTQASGLDPRVQTEYLTQSTAGAGTAATFTQAANTQRITFMIALKSGAGGSSLSSAGAGAAAFVGAAATAAVLSCAGVAGGSLVGASAAAATLASSGVGAANLVGASAAASVLASSGAGAASFTSAAATASVLASAGIAAVNLAGASDAAAVLASSGASTVTWLGASSVTAVLSAVGAGAFTAVAGSGTSDAVFGASGVGAFAGVSAAAAASVLASAGTSTVVWSGPTPVGSGQPHNRYFVADVGRLMGR